MNEKGDENRKFLYYKPLKKKKVSMKTVEMSGNHIKITQGFVVIKEPHRGCDFHKNEPLKESRIKDLVHVYVSITITQASVLIIPALLTVQHKFVTGNIFNLTTTHNTSSSLKMSSHKCCSTAIVVSLIQNCSSSRFHRFFLGISSNL